MKHGIHIPKDKREGMARRAAEIRKSVETKAEALRQIEDEFDVSTPTARNLLGLGMSLTAD